MQLKQNNNLFVIHILLFLGTISWSLTMIKSGFTYPFGMGFWGANGHDGIWHIALINSLAKGSFKIPVFAGHGLQNYHIGFDLLLALVNRITSIPAHVLYFQIVPPLMATLIGFLVYRFILLWRGSQYQALWATFLVYFGGSFGWVVTLLRGQGFGGESMFWSQQAVSTLVNPPFALSLIFLLLGLILLVRLEENFSIWYLLLTILSFGVLVQIKAYAAVLVLVGLAITWLWQVVQKTSSLHRDRVFLVFLGTLLLSAILFLPLNRESSSLIIWQPFWFLETMMSYTDRFGWTKYFDAMTTYRMGHIWAKSIPAYILAFVIFWIGNTGTRFVKEILVWRWIKNISKVGVVEIFLSSTILLGVILPMFFLQRGTPWNTIQFVYYSLFFSGIVSGIVFGGWFEKEQNINKKKLLSLLIIILTVPTTVSTLLTVYLPVRPPAIISKPELAALEVLKQQPDGIVLTYPFDKFAAKKAEDNPPRPLYLYESTAYVSAFSGKPVYLEDEVNLNIMGYDWQERREKVEDFFDTLDQEKAKAFLRDNNIRYVYWVAKHRTRVGDAQIGMTQVFENEEVQIYRVD